METRVPNSLSPNMPESIKFGSVRWRKSTTDEWTVVQPGERAYSTALMAATEVYREDGWEEIIPDVIHELAPSLTDEDVINIYREVSEGAGNHGHFLTFFAKAVVYADYENVRIVLPIARVLIDKYDLRQHLVKQAMDLSKEIEDRVKKKSNW